MKFRQLIDEVQNKSGFSSEESIDALECMVESLAVHLNEGDRKYFAAELPTELHDIALSVGPTERTAHQEFIEQFMEQQGIEEKEAKKQILFSWDALKHAVSAGQIAHIRAQLPISALLLLR